MRLASVLTDAPLEADPLLPNRCGTCRNCQEACPVKAIHGAGWEDHPQSREEALHLSKCLEKLTEDFARRPGVGKNICGICIKVCPWGKSR
ncbi:MAG TPA: 4Fe-4S double cluster binding domain-containing protein [Spirochaetia bacterium]|nr:4Fe-4S double cluster binding domain-containing protein [Spirochaetia bacterium]